MKWFMHESAANRDTKLRKVLIKYGAEGYGLYWYCLEHVCAAVDPKLTFELEHDSEILAHELRVDTLKVEEMMRYMVRLGLFDASGDVISCIKLARYLGDKNTRNADLQTIIRHQKHHLSATVRDSPRQSALEERRGEEIREDKNKKRVGQNRKRFTPPTVDEVAEYTATREVSIDPARFVDFYASKDWMVGKNKMKDWQAAVRNWERREDGQSTSNGRKNTRGPEVVTAADLINEGYVING